ncbi:hypothetical protein [Sulfurimonas sp.]|uniref:hypothetical protein n=1 Tax=Sulfurimonas sp. TaxID=2022749 RepID=UPI0035645057
MKKIIFIFTGLFIFGNCIFASEDINSSKNDKMLKLYASLGITNLDRRNNNPNFDYKVETLYEVEASVSFLPDSYNLTVGYKTSINNDSTKGIATNTDSKAKTIFVGVELLESTKYGYLDFEYNHITLDAAIKNTSTSRMYVTDVLDTNNIAPGQPYNNMAYIPPNEVAATKEMTNSYMFTYRLASFPNFGVTFGSFYRHIPVAIQDTTFTNVLLSRDTDAEGYIYGLGYFDDFKNAPKNKLVIKRVAYTMGTLDTETLNVNNRMIVTGEASTDTLFIDLGYKFYNFELLVNGRYMKSNTDNFSVYTVSGIKQEEIATTVSLAMRY